MLAEWTSEFLSLSLSLSLFVCNRPVACEDTCKGLKTPQGPGRIIMSILPAWLIKAYDSVQHPLLWASLQRKGVHGKMLAAIQSLYSGGAMSMKICGRAGATGTAQVGVRQGCPLSPTLFGLFFDDLYSQLQSDCPSAGVECRGNRIPSLFYADDVALLSASAQGLQQLLDSM